MDILTLFVNIRDIRGRRETLTPSQFAANYSDSPFVRTEKDGPGWSPAAFRKNETRTDYAVESLNWLVLDFDNDGKDITSIDEALAYVDGYEVIYHTSHSHTEDKPKFRLILPLDRPAEPREWGAVWYGGLSLCGDDPAIDTSCKNLSRTYYLPSKKTDDAPYEAGYEDGERISVDKLIEISGYEVGENIVSFSVGDSKENTGRFNKIKRLAVAMLHRCEPFQEVVNEVLRVDYEEHDSPIFAEKSRPGMHGSPEANATFFVAGLMRTLTAGGVEVAPVIPKPVKSNDITFENNHNYDLHLLDLPYRKMPDILVPGLVGEIRDYIEVCAHQAQPNLALGAALTAVGTVVGRKVKSPSNLRSNLMVLALAGTGEGKDNARKVIRRIYREAGIDDDYLGGETFSSGSAILKAVSERPSGLFLLDEFGHELTRFNNKGDVSASVPAMMMRLFTSASETFRGNEAATYERIDIEQPNMSIYATTTPDKLFDSLGNENIVDGFLGRWLVFHSDTIDQPFREVEEVDTPPAITAKLKALHWIGTSNKDNDIQIPFNSKEFIPTPETIKVTEEAKAIHKQYIDHWFEMKKGRKDSERAVLARVYEHSMKTALVIAAGHTFEIDKEVMLAACQLVDYLSGLMLHHVQQFGAASDHYKYVKKAVRYIDENGGAVKQSELYRATKLDKVRLQAVIDYLVQGEYCEVVQKSTGGRPVNLFAFTKDFCTFISKHRNEKGKKVAV